MITIAHNFRDIFNKNSTDSNVKGVVIPIVQRDYAQGRNTPEVNRIRTRFLNVLYDALVNGKSTTLDFIYGNVEEGKLIPLDGQQRLTTLFLLHYYVAMHENISVEERDFLKNFTYKTRISSREFCEHLVDFCPDFGLNSLSEQIKDQAWFLLEWESDPTVQAMLVMLDSIDEKFRTTSGLWEKLTGDAITFYFLPLEQMGVTDELYIKMNSRGKPLSAFEHFKAELELKMKEVDPVISERIATKIDREWTDLLWPYRNSCIGSSGVDEVTDDEFLRYIHFISDIISYRNGSFEIADDFDMIDQQFSKSCVNARENMLMLEQCFDLWVWASPEKTDKLDIKYFFESLISRDIYQPEKILIEQRDEYDTIPDLFGECCKCYGRKNGLRPMFPLGRTILLYSVLVFMKNKDNITEQNFRRRLRIVNNLVKNSSNTLRSEYMKELLMQVDKIIIEGVIEQVDEGKARFQNRQMEEESEKLQWVERNPDKAELLYKLEDHPYLNGFVKAVAGDNFEHVDWCERFYSLFRCDLKEVNRALLSTGDYFEKDGSWRHQIGTSNSRLAQGVWRSLFSPVRLEDNLCIVLQHLLSEHEVFTDDLLRDISNSYLQESTEMPVRYYLVKYEQTQTNMAGDYRFGKFYWRNHQKQGRNSYKVIVMTTELNFGFNYDIFLKTLFTLTGGSSKGLQIGNYSFTEYNNGGKDKLIMGHQNMYLTLDEDVYTICKEEGEEVESRKIEQRNGVNIEDRVEVGLQLLKKYMEK